MLSGCVPIAHMYLTEGIGGVAGFPLKALVVMECWYGAGTVFYVSHWPEKYFPKKFDIWVRIAGFCKGVCVIGRLTFVDDGRGRVIKSFMGWWLWDSMFI